MTSSAGDITTNSVGKPSQLRIPRFLTKSTQDALSSSAGCFRKLPLQVLSVQKCIVKRLPIDAVI